MQIPSISGSLRAASTNTTLLKAAAALVPEHVTLNLYLGSAISRPAIPTLTRILPTLPWRTFALNCVGRPE